MSTSQALMLAVGVLLLAACLVWRRASSPATRWWVGSRSKESAVLLGYPALGVLLVLAGLVDVLRRSAALEVVAGVLLVLALGAGLWAMLVGVPRWLTPAHLHPVLEQREADRKRRKGERRSRRG